MLCLLWVSWVCGFCVGWCNIVSLDSGVGLAGRVGLCTLVLGVLGMMVVFVL